MPPRAGRREWLGLVVLFLPTLLVAVDNTVLSFALPAISSALAPSATELLWIVDVYPLALAGLLVTMGTLGDRLGRRRLLLIGVAGFGAVSAAAAFATEAAHLVAARALLGVFGAMLMPSTLALLRTLFVDRDQRRLALAIWATGFAAGAALGPVLGGVLLEHAWWGSVFLVNVPVMVAVAGAGAGRAPGVARARPAAGQLDLLGLHAVDADHGLVRAGREDPRQPTSRSRWPSWPSRPRPAVAFVARARRGVRRAASRCSTWSCSRRRCSAWPRSPTPPRCSPTPGCCFLLTQYLQLVAGLSPLQAGLLLVPGSLVTMAAGVGAARLARYAPVPRARPDGPAARGGRVRRRASCWAAWAARWPRPCWSARGSGCRRR